MQLFRDYQSKSLKQSVVTIGNFDGLHLGHQALIENMVATAKQLQCPSVLLSFEPLPTAFFKPDAMHQIMPFRTKAELLKQWSIDYFGMLRFNQAFSELSAQDFIKQCLMQSLGVKELYVGKDFRFGHAQTGDVALLQSFGDKYGFEVHVIDDICLEGERVSSSIIRQGLTTGDIKRVNDFLGYPFTLVARIHKGKELGKKLGFPTANLKIAPKFILLNGVYICWAMIKGKRLPAVCNVGYQPTVSSFRKKVEVHVLDYKGCLYGQIMQVSFLEKIRNEKKFKDVTELIENIKHDTIVAKRYFEKRQQTHSI